MRVLAPAQTTVEALEGTEAPDFSDVYREHVRTVACWVARLGGPAVDAEAVTHDVFVKVQRELPRFRGDARLTTWLYAITANTVRTRRRIERFRRLFLGEPAQAPNVADPRPLAPELLAQREAELELYRLLDQLSERDRQVLVLFELEGRSGREVAELLDVPIDRVWVLRHRAKTRLTRVSGAPKGEL